LSETRKGGSGQGEGKGFDIVTLGEEKGVFRVETKKGDLREANRL